MAISRTIFFYYYFFLGNSSASLIIFSAFFPLFRFTPDTSLYFKFSFHFLFYDPVTNRARYAVRRGAPYMSGLPIGPPQASVYMTDQAALQREAYLLRVA